MLSLRMLVILMWSFLIYNILVVLFNRLIFSWIKVIFTRSSNINKTDILCLYFCTGKLVGNYHRDYLTLTSCPSVKFTICVLQPCYCLLCTGSFPGVKQPGRGVDHPPPSSAQVKERLELYLYSPSGPSWPVVGWTLPLLLTHSLVKSTLVNLSMF
jgi:hypothetical protein